MQLFKSGEECLTYGELKQRLIFYKQAWSDSEQKAVLEFKQFCKTKGQKIPTRDAEILKWLYGKGFDNQKTLDALMVKINFINEQLPYKVSTGVFELLNNGFIYICGRDRFYRPIMVVRQAVLNSLPEPPSEQDLIGCAMIMMEYFQWHMMTPGHVENGINIMDNQHQGVTAIPIFKLKTVLSTIQSMYKSRNRVIFSVRSNPMISLLFNAISYFLDEPTQKKVNMTTENSHPLMHELIAPNQLEQCFGGTFPDRVVG